MMASVALSLGLSGSMRRQALCRKCRQCLKLADGRVGGGDQVGDGRLIQAMAMPQDDYLDSQKSLGEHSESERRPYAPSYSFQLS